MGLEGQFSPHCFNLSTFFKSNVLLTYKNDREQEGKDVGTERQWTCSSRVRGWLSRPPAGSCILALPLTNFGTLAWLLNLDVLKGLYL